MSTTTHERPVDEYVDPREDYGQDPNNPKFNTDREQPVLWEDDLHSPSDHILPPDMSADQAEGIYQTWLEEKNEELIRDNTSGRPVNPYVDHPDNRRNYVEQVNTNAKNLNPNVPVAIFTPEIGSSDDEQPDPEASTSPERIYESYNKWCDHHDYVDDGGDESNDRFDFFMDHYNGEFAEYKDNKRPDVTDHRPMTDDEVEEHSENIDRARTEILKNKLLRKQVDPNYTGGIDGEIVYSRRIKDDQARREMNDYHDEAVDFADNKSAETGESKYIVYEHDEYIGYNEKADDDKDDKKKFSFNPLASLSGWMVAKSHQVSERRSQKQIAKNWDKAHEVNQMKEGRRNYYLYRQEEIGRRNEKIRKGVFFGALGAAAIGSAWLGVEYLQSNGNSTADGSSALRAHNSLSGIDPSAHSGALETGQSIPSNTLTEAINVPSDASVNLDPLIATTSLGNEHIAQVHETVNQAIYAKYGDGWREIVCELKDVQGQSIPESQWDRIIADSADQLKSIGVAYDMPSPDKNGVIGINSPGIISEQAMNILRSHV